MTLNKLRSEDEDSQKYIHKVTSCFQKVACPDKILDEEQFKVRFSDNEKK